jgi:ATP-dependent Clp protease ATP-binding subunit ClpC
LKDPKRPIGSFIFLGPTGVGKTELAKALAEALFGDENAMVRLDMSEYMERHTVSRLVGSPPGYVGYDEGGQLTERVRRKPYSVLLLDEIEKAHPEVFNILLQILEDGRLTDAHGRRVDFRNTVIIMTSNVGANLFQQNSPIGFQMGAPDEQEDEAGYERMKENVLDELKRTFRPEFLNRIDEVIVFHALTRKEITAIVDLMLRPVQLQLAEKGLTLEVNDAVRDLLVKDGYDPAFGARPLRRSVQRLIENPLSEDLLQGKLPTGAKIKAEVDEGKIVFKPVGTKGRSN